MFNLLALTVLSLLPQTLSSTPSHTLGNVYNYWSILPNLTIDLTRSSVLPITTPLLLPFAGTRPAALVEPSRTALCIVDMQNFFLHPSLAPRSVSGRAAVTAVAALVRKFRQHGMPVSWVNWGLTESDLLTLPPAFKSGFSNGTDDPNKSMGSDMGTITDPANSSWVIQVGRMLMRGSWNAEPWGILKVLKDEGLEAGTDRVFHKNRLSGLWGAQTPYGMWLQENEVTTVFFAGVNADQCVWSTLVDAYFKGYDVVYVDDICATTSPAYATEMTRYNADGYGFLANSTALLAALG